VNLQTIVSRNVDPTLPGVVTVGSFQAGKGFNVIADTCSMNGTSRAFDPHTRELIHKRITDIVGQTCSMYGAEYEYEFKWGYPSLINHASEYERFRRVGSGLFGESHTLECPMIMAAEDFAYYLEKVPGCYMFVGAGNAEMGITAPHHHPKFDFDEQAMKTSVRLLAGMAIDYLNEHAG
jgi:amidohydrolase